MEEEKDNESWLPVQLSGNCGNFKSKTCIDRLEEVEEKTWMVFLQAIIPFLVAGLGLLGTGLFLNTALHFELFLKTEEMVILVPILLGLKGNLEMTFASRISTLSNCGELETKEEILSTLFANLALIESQAITLSFMAGILSIIIGAVKFNKFDARKAFIIVGSSVMAASISSIILGIFMIFVVVMSHKCKINPDNVSSPIAASFGDIVTLVILVATGTLLFAICSGEQCVVVLIPVLILMIFAPFFMWCASKSEYTKDVLLYGWWAVIAATILSSGGGYILQCAVSMFPGIAAFQPLMAGLGGNRIAVLSSRLSTELHLSGTEIGSLPQEGIFVHLNPLRILCPIDLNMRFAILLIYTAVPINILFVVIICFIDKDVDFSWKLLSMFIIGSLIQAFTLLYICQLVVPILWKAGFDPDHSAVPILTSFADVFGTGLLYSMFIIIHYYYPGTLKYKLTIQPNITITQAPL